MRGKNIVNVYVINSREYLRKELNEEQLLYIAKVADKQKYNQLRHKLLVENGDDVYAIIKIYFPEQTMVVEY